MQTCVKNVFPVVTYRRLITKEILNMLAPKVFADAYKIWSLLRDCKYSDFTWKLLLFWKTGSEKRWSLMRGGCNQRCNCILKAKENRT